jgi:hypothetical protein
MGGAAAGDLYLHVTIDPHSQFLVLGDDIQVDLSVTPWEAMLGAKVNVPTLDKQVEMKIPAGSQAGQRLRLRRQGLNQRAGGRGDEYVKLTIVVPSSPTVREKELFEHLAAESRFNPREQVLLPCLIWWNDCAVRSKKMRLCVPGCSTISWHDGALPAAVRPHLSIPALGRAALREFSQDADARGNCRRGMDPERPG